MRVRENAEAIAFYQGEQYESDRIRGKFLEVFDNFKRLIFWELNLNILTNAYEFIPFILPAIVVAPGIFAGELEVGKVTEAQGAFIRVFFSLNLIVSRFQSLANFGAGVERLYSFLEFLETSDSTVNQPDGSEQPTIKTEITTNAPSPVENCLALENITLQTPNYQRILIENLSVKCRFPLLPRLIESVMLSNVHSMVEELRFFQVELPIQMRLYSKKFGRFKGVVASARLLDVIHFSAPNQML